MVRILSHVPQVHFHTVRCGVGRGMYAGNSARAGTCRGREYPNEGQFCCVCKFATLDRLEPVFATWWPGLLGGEQVMLTTISKVGKD